MEMQRMEIDIKILIVKLLIQNGASLDLISKVKSQSNFKNLIELLNENTL